MVQPSMQELMEKAKEMQQQMQKAQQEIVAIKVIGQAGGGLVKVHMTGGYKVARVMIDVSLMSNDVDEVEDLVAAAFNDASNKIDSETKSRMVSIAKDMKLPEDFASSDDGGNNE